ncbi:MAG: glycoside hydrolase family 16 protein [Chloroflexi bacterium]|nr:glycoside hydrolase family 16 protein [Chloroflexota bacterium]MCI0578856.1 glycoside hydrolase family 16 protein [Chloroflexota bacterium]MCI0643952.1 glycoside hydrolase family 16 protein [Chloroflexota bacterium]MCI0732083.1 glycoside hydrolase family 16 protein [Chloroflexota bacterium]
MNVTPTPAATPTPVPTPTPIGYRQGWELIWHDEFDGPDINPANWTYDLGGGGWGNNERQYYTNRPENARIENGLLVIEARQESYRGWPYTSARLKTLGLQEFTYGRIEARLKAPYGQGIWPAFWALGNNFPQAGWPVCGEIDIMEHIGKEPPNVYGTVHGPGYSGSAGLSSHYTLPAGRFSDDFHVLAVEWESERIRWFMDGHLYHTITPADLPGEWVFDHPFFLLLNVAVGGYWPGYPDDTTVFPQVMLVDYVRVYQPT